MAVPHIFAGLPVAAFISASTVLASLRRCGSGMPSTNFFTLARFGFVLISAMVIVSCISWPVALCRWTLRVAGRHTASFAARLNERVAKRSHIQRPLVQLTAFLVGRDRCERGRNQFEPLEIRAKDEGVRLIDLK